MQGRPVLARHQKGVQLLALYVGAHMRIQPHGRDGGTAVCTGGGHRVATGLCGPIFNSRIRNLIDAHFIRFRDNIMVLLFTLFSSNEKFSMGRDEKVFVCVYHAMA